MNVAVTAEKDGLIDVTILPLESENSYWDFYQTGNTEVNLRSKVKQTIQQDLGDVDPNAQNLITIHYVNRPRKLQIDGTNMWVYNGNSSAGPVSPQESQMRNIWNSCVQLLHQLYYSSLPSQQENLKTIYHKPINKFIPTATVNTMVRWLITYPNVDETTLFHEYAHGFDFNFVNESNRGIVQQAYDNAVNQWQSQYGYIPSFTTTCDANNQNCAPYQLYSVSEFFAVLSTAYHGFSDGTHPIGGNTPPQLQNANDILNFYPTMHALFVNIYGNPPTTSSGSSSTTTTSSTSYTTTLTPFTNPDSGYGNFTKKVVVLFQ